MSWQTGFIGSKSFRKFLGLEKVKTPKVAPPEELAAMDEFESDAYLKMLAQKSGFEKTIMAGRRKPKLARPGGLAAKSYLGVI